LANKGGSKLTFGVLLVVRIFYLDFHAVS